MFVIWLLLLLYLPTFCDDDTVLSVRQMEIILNDFFYRLQYFKHFSGMQNKISYFFF